MSLTRTQRRSEVGPPSRGPSGGFTLVELLIVVAIIAALAAIAVPNLLAAKLNANETSALAALRNLVSSQAQLVVAGRIDADRDGRGEYGTILELSGAVGTRRGFAPGPPGTADFSLRGPPIEPAILSASFSVVNPQGFATKSGYAFSVLLPDGAAPGGFVHEVGPAASPSFDGDGPAVGVDASEVSWCAYAQPLLMGSTGRRRFFANQAGDLLQSQNEVARGQGTAAAVAGPSALLGTGFTASPAIGTRGRDGDVWTVAN